MIHVLEYEIEFAAVLAKVDGVRLVCHYFDHIDDVGMLQLTQYFDFAHGRDRKAFFLVLELNTFESDQLVRLDVACLEHLAVGALTDYLELAKKYG